jgi:hypothetical protein
MGKRKRRLTRARKKIYGDTMTGCTYIYKEIILMTSSGMKNQAMPDKRCCGLMCVNFVDLIV